MDQHNNADDQLIHVHGIHIPSTGLMNSIISMYITCTFDTIDTCTLYTQKIFFLEHKLQFEKERMICMAIKKKSHHVPINLIKASINHQYFLPGSNLKLVIVNV